MALGIRALRGLAPGGALPPALLLCALLSTSWAAPGGPTPGRSHLGPVFHSISINEGLPGPNVEAIVQDRWGYIWIGTRTGLARHEGDRLRILPSETEQPGALPGSNIMSLMAAADGTLWAAIEDRGVVQLGEDLRIQRHIDTLDHGGPLPSEQVWAMQEDCDGGLWLALMSGGVIRLDQKRESWHHHEQTPAFGLDAEGYQVQLALDSDCRIWLAQTGQLSVFDPVHDRFQAVWNMPSGKYLLALTELDGQMHFNEGGRLLRLDPFESGLAEPAAAEQKSAGDERTDAWPAVQELARTEGTITDIVRDPHSGRYLLATTAGLYHMEPGRPESLKHIAHIPGLADGLPAEGISSMMLDEEGGLWLASSRDGAAYLPPGWIAFERYQPLPGGGGLNIDPVRSLFYDEVEGGFWVGGLRGEIEFLPVEPSAGRGPVLGQAVRNAFRGNAIVNLHRVGDFLYVVGQARVSRIDLRAGGAPTHLYEREKRDVGVLYRAWRPEPDTLWLATRDKGLIILDESTGQARHYHADSPDHLPEGVPKKFLRGHEGQPWLVTTRGVYAYSPTEGFIWQATASPLRPASAVWTGAELWVASDQELERWRRTGGGGFETVERHAFGPEVPPGRTLDLAADELGGLWLVRTSGLFHLPAGQQRMQSLTTHDGLAAVEFGEQEAVSLPDGQLAFVGRGGIVRVDPARLLRNKAVPQVHVLRLQAGEKTLELWPGKPASLALDHAQNSFYLDYMATSYQAWERIRYQVWLEGWDPDWIELPGQTRQHYSSLPSGQYRFHVRAAVADGPWSEQAAVLDLNIARPPWRSVWALVAYALALAAMAAVAWRGLRRARQRRQEIRDARHKRNLAERQRRLIARLNRNLDPEELGHTIAREAVAVVGGQWAWLGHDQIHLSDALLASSAEAPPLSREAWLQRRENPLPGDVWLELEVDRHASAHVLVTESPGVLDEETQERLQLLGEMASQSLRNALLLQHVRTLAEQADQANQAKSEFLATMSHEIRTPLHGLMGMVELLHQDSTEPGQREALTTLQYSGLQLRRIIDDVLDISRIEAGRMELKHKPFELATLLEQVVDLHAASAFRKGLDLRLRNSPGLPPLALGDPLRLAQVLGNLLSNAIKFTQQGAVEISTASGPGGALVITVSDSGPGVSPRERDALFQPFSQLDTSKTRSHGGSGLGLAICQQLASAMKGSLELVDRPGSGACFRVRLPLLPESSPACWRPSKLLEGQLVGAWLSSPTLRVLRAMGRRWSFQVVDARHAPPQPADLLLADPELLEAEPDRLEPWRREAGCLAWLTIAGRGRNAAPGGGQQLRWPLLESRLISLLMDIRLTQR